MEGRKEEIRARFGENRRITGEYDAALSVKCVNGTFAGKMAGHVLEFKGIPFVGEQPGGKNRFKEPVPFQEDDGVYEAYYYAKSPCQPEQESEEASLYVQGEDCLYLNVWNNTEDACRKKPVMVWIHGGAFSQSGTSDPLYDGHNFAAANPDVILVSITYRVGPFGFLHLTHLPDGADYTSTQNLGLLDQQMALRWIHENIAAFGGDPENVTIFGESAGGTSVSLLTLMEEAPRYFHRAISQSGPVAHTRSTEDAIGVTNELMEILGVSTVKELKELPAEKLAEAAANFPLRIWAERDGIIIPKDPYQAFAEGKANGIDFLQGFNKDELGYFILCLGGPESFTEFLKPRVEAKIAGMEPEDAANARRYLEDTPGREFVKIRKFGDQMLFIAPAFRVSENMASAGGRGYLYYFTVESTLRYVGSGHAVEIAGILNNRHLVGLNGRAFDETFCRTMQRMWVKFAKTGDPSLTAEESPTEKAIEWKAYNTENKDIMVFDEFNIHPDTEPDLGILDWKRGYPLTKYFMWC